MFTNEELSAIDPSYFLIIQAGGYSVTLQSKNTLHYWHILSEEGPGFSTCQISHKHHPENPYHRHGNKPDFESALKAIRSHDMFHISKQKKKRS